MIRAVVAAAALALCLGGIGTVAVGIAVPIKAAAGQRDLAAVFDRRLATIGETRATARGLTIAPSTDWSGMKQGTARREEGPVARLSVERLGVREIVLAGAATHDQLSRAPTMLKRGDAASPVTVLASHRDTHFRFIQDLREGDEITLQTTDRGVVDYRVTRFETVRWDRFAVPRDPARPMLALTTCYPFGGTEYGGPWRRVAWAEQVE